jgi:hypothetical protein
MDKMKVYSKPISGWALSEFGKVDFCDKRLSTRLLKLAGSFAESPESPINQACADWSATKAAYRFFQNDRVLESKILAAHVARTVERSNKYDTILAIQDTCYISYKNHKKTKGLGIIASRIRSHATNFRTPGLVMHTAFAITTEGLPLGLLDQKINSRLLIPEELKALKKKSHNIALSIEEKESIRWIESLKKSNHLGLENTRVVTLCDREGDIYDLFEVACRKRYSVLTRAHHDRVVNKKSTYSGKGGQRLWDVAKSFICKGEIKVTIPARNDKAARTALLEIRFGSFIMNPPKNNIKRRTEKLPNLKLNLVYVLEKNSPVGEEPIEWMLLSNIPICSFEEAVEKVKWYGLRWRIEVFHKVLKSGLRVEECRLGTADRLIRYLTVMSVIAWRIFFIALLAREDPNTPCTRLFAEEEWKVLYSKIHSTKTYPSFPPTIKEAVRWVSQLGGFLGRKNDGEPGPMVLWRGWKRLFDLTEGWNLALSSMTP